MKNISNENSLECDLNDLINSVDLENEVKNSRGSLLEKTKYFFSKFNKNSKEFMQKTPLFAYSLKRIFYAFITLYLAIGVVYMLLVTFMPDTALISDFNWTHPPVNPNDPVAWAKYMENKRIAYGLEGSFLKQVLIYWRNITPFIKKEVFIPLNVSATTIDGEYETKWFWLGVILNKSNGIKDTSVFDAFKEAIPTSFSIGLIALLSSYIIGVPLGILAAKNKEKAVDNGINWLFLGITSMPATILITLLWIASMRIFGSAGIWGENMYSNMFAIIAVMFLMMPVIVINTRRFVIDEMTSDYTKFAISKGLSSSYVFYVHIFRNASIRVIKTFPEALVLCLFGSSILVEQFWGVQGMSRFILQGVGTNDIYVVLGYITLSAAIGIFASLLSDLIMALMDPRVSLTK